MRRVLTVVTLLSLLLNFSSPSFAATTFKGPENASESARCNSLNQYSFSKSGPLICSKGKWVKVVSNKDTVASRSYRSLLARYNAMPNSTPNIIFRKDPKAGVWKNKIALGLNAAARLWGTSKPDDAAIYAYLSEGAAYISEQLKADGITENPDDAARNRKASPPSSTQAGFHGKYFDFIFSDLGSTDPGYYQVGPHEYTHLAQRVFANSKNDSIQREFWLDEGCATYVGTSMGGLIAFPQNQRSALVERLTYESIPVSLSFFSQKGPELYGDVKFHQVYEMGSFACEALVALKGIDVIEKYYSSLAVEGATPENIATEVFGTTLTSVITLTQKYVDSVRKGKELTLSQLQNEYKKMKTTTK